MTKGDNIVCANQHGYFWKHKSSVFSETFVTQFSNYEPANCAPQRAHVLRLVWAAPSLLASSFFRALSSIAARKCSGVCGWAGRVLENSKFNFFKTDTIFPHIKRYWHVVFSERDPSLVLDQRETRDRENRTGNIVSRLLANWTGPLTIGGLRTATTALCCLLSCQCICSELLSVARANKPRLPYSQRERGEFRANQRVLLQYFLCVYCYYSSSITKQLMAGCRYIVWCVNEKDVMAAEKRERRDLSN